METHGANYKKTLFWFAVGAAWIYVIHIASDLVNNHWLGLFAVVSSTMALGFIVKAFIDISKRS